MSRRALYIRSSAVAIPKEERFFWEFIKTFLKTKSQLTYFSQNEQFFGQIMETWTIIINPLYRNWIQFRKVLCFSGKKKNNRCVWKAMRLFLCFVLNFSLKDDIALVNLLKIHFNLFNGFIYEIGNSKLWWNCVDMDNFLDFFKNFIIVC